MKQLLLRVDDGVHARLRERARREHRSINAIAGDILEVAATIDPTMPREVIKARAAALGILASRAPRTAESQPSDAPAPPTVDMDRISGLTAGWGAQLDDLLDEDRGRA